jgi:hypothetical protein
MWGRPQVNYAFLAHSAGETFALLGCYAAQIRTLLPTFKNNLSSHLQGPSSSRRLIVVVCFLLGNSPASEFYMPTFRNTVCSIFIGGYAWRMTRFEKVRVFIQEKFWLENSLRLLAQAIFEPTFSNQVLLHTYPPINMEQTECSETSEYKIQTPGNYPEEIMQHSEHGESLKSRRHCCTDGLFRNVDN